MKNILLLISLFITFKAFGQAIPPPVNPQPVPQMSWSREPSTNKMFANRGPVLGYWQPADSLQVVRMIGYISPTLTFNGGLTRNINTVKLGGTLIGNTILNSGTNIFAVTNQVSGANGESLFAVGAGNFALSGIINNRNNQIATTTGLEIVSTSTVDGKQQSIKMHNADFVIEDGVNSIGLLYLSDYSALGHLNPLWIPNYGYIQSDFVDKSTNQTILGNKLFKSPITITDTTNGIALTLNGNGTALTVNGFAQFNSNISFAGNLTWDAVTEVRGLQFYKAGDPINYYQLVFDPATSSFGSAYDNANFKPFATQHYVDSLASLSPATTASNGITKTGNDFQLGNSTPVSIPINIIGEGSTNTISIGQFDNFSSPTSIAQFGTGVDANGASAVLTSLNLTTGKAFIIGVDKNKATISSSQGKIDLTTSGMIVTDQSASPKGLQYAFNYDGTLGVNSLTPKRYVDSVAAGAGVGVYQPKFETAQTDTGSYPIFLWFGDSITAGSGATIQGLQGYAHLYSNNIKTRENNYAIPGTSLVKFTTGDNSMIDRIALIPIKTAAYKTIAFNYGTNDFRNASGTYNATNFQNAYFQVVDTCIARGWTPASIILITPPYLAEFATDSSLMAIVKNVANTRGCVFANAFTYMKNHGGLSLINSDSLHPTNLGHMVMDTVLLNLNYATNKQYFTFNQPVAITGNLNVGHRITGGNGTNGLEIWGANFDGFNAYPNTRITSMTNHYFAKNLSVAGSLSNTAFITNGVVINNNVGVFATMPVLQATLGGTGISSYTTGSLLYANSTTSVGQLNDVALGAVLISAGTTSVPVYSTTPTVSSITLTTGATVSGGNINMSGGGQVVGAGLTGLNTNSNVAIQGRGFTAAGVGVSMATGTVTNSSGVYNAVNINPTYNQTSTAGGTDLKVNRTEIAIGSGAQLLADLQVASVSKFSVDRLGNINSAGHVTFEGVTSTGATGTGQLVFGTSPTFTTPSLGTPASGVLTNTTGLPTAGLVNNAVTYAKMQAVTTNKLLGSGSGTAVSEITLGTALSFTGSTLNVATINRSHTIFTPTTGGTVILINNQFNIINPAGTLVALTVTLPSSPANNDIVNIKYTQAVTTVTYNGGTVVDGITSPVAGGLVILTYDAATTSWY